MKSIVMVAYAEAQILDVTGPIEVFDVASKLLAERSKTARPYRVELVAPSKGAIVMSNGISLIAAGAFARLRGPIDTLLVAGGLGSRRVVQDAAFIRTLQRQAARARRLASICTGAFCLAQAGLLDGRRATTHWASCARLASDFPKIEVVPDAIYVKDGSVWTSAGVTAGMDLALAMVEEDFGTSLALEVARHLVVFLKRPGGQSQFSRTLEAQGAQREPLRELPSWIAERLADDLSVPRLARRSGMSPRNFARSFAREVGVTPARYVEQVRVEAARRKLEESTGADLERVAHVCGFGSAEVMRRAFQRQLHVSPRSYRERFESTR